VGSCPRQRSAVVLNVTDEVYLNGEFVPRQDARISVMDRGFLFGDGVYEVIPAYGGRLFRLEHHLDRLDNSLQSIRMSSPLSRSEWIAIMGRLLAVESGADQSVYLQVTRGAPPERDHLFPGGSDPSVFVMARPFKPRRSEIAERGVAAITLEDIRWHCCNVKAVTLLANVLLRQAAEDAGAAEAILVRQGLALEGSSTNLFAVKGGELITPPKGDALLPGITRDLVLELAQADGIPHIERDITASELAQAEEVWLTSSTREVMPVTRLNGAPIVDGLPGPIWRRIDALYGAYKARVRRGDI
jgi:D-alanine transaminase